MRSALPPAVQPVAPSFHEIFRQESSYVLNSLRRLGVQERDLEDVTHDVFLVVHRRLGEYDPLRPLRPWLFGIALRRAAGYRKRARHRYEVMSDAECTDGRPTADELYANRQKQALLIESLEALEPEQRAVFILHDLDEVSMPEIAGQLSVPINTAYSRLRLARERLRNEVLRRKGEHS